jgi:hypothetical protein
LLKFRWKWAEQMNFLSRQESDSQRQRM